MRAISFAWTAPALLAGRKTVTRREWDDRYAATFHAGELVAAYDRQPRFRGVQIATIRLIANPTFEPMAAMPDGDYEGEGWAYFAEHPEQRPKTILGQVVTPATFTRGGFEHWRSGGGEMWVIRFDLVEAAK